MRRWQSLAAAVTASLFLAAAASAVFLVETTTLRQSSLPKPLDERARAVVRATGAAAIPARLRAADGALLEGTVFIPMDQPVGAVILFHGLGDDRTGMLWPAELFLQAGFVTLTPDLRAHGASGGDRLTFGFLEARDAAAWAEWMTRRFHPQRIFAMGHSLGAAVALQALQFTDRFDAVIAEAPFSDFPQIAGEHIEEMAGIPKAGWLGRPIAELAFLWTRLRFQFDLSLASPLNAVKNSQSPVLLIHGARDETIPVEHSRRLRDANPAKVQLWEVPDGHNNDLPRVAGPAYKATLTEWFRSFLPRDPS